MGQIPAPPIPRPGRTVHRLDALHAEVLGHSGEVEIVEEWGRGQQARCLIRWREHDGLQRQDCVYRSALQERFIPTCRSCGQASLHDLCLDCVTITPSTCKPPRVVLKDQVVTSS